MINFYDIKSGQKLFFDSEVLRYAAIITSKNDNGIYIKWNESGCDWFWDKNQLEDFHIHP